MKNSTPTLRIFVAASGLLFCQISLANQCPFSNESTPFTNAMLPCTLPGVIQNNSGTLTYGHAYIKTEQTETTYTFTNVDTQNRTINAANADYFVHCDTAENKATTYTGPVNIIKPRPKIAIHHSDKLYL